MPLDRYLAHPDPLTAASNLIALSVGGNAPFYPLYAWLAAGSAWRPAAITLVLMPVFLAIPIIARRRPLLSRLMMAGFGALNVIDCTYTLGQAAGVELFLLPCVILGPLLFHPGERAARWSMTALPILLFWLLHGRYPASPFALDAAQSAAMLTLNSFSVASLIAFLAFVLSGAQRRAAEPPTS